MSVEEKRLIILCIATILAGVIISIVLGDNELPRAGAFIVGLGVYFGASDITKHYSKAESEMRVKMVFDILEERAKAKETPLTEEIFRGTETKIKSVYKEAFEKIDYKRSRIIKTEGLTILFGTLLWGFGDLIKLF